MGVVLGSGFEMTYSTDPFVSSMRCFTSLLNDKGTVIKEGQINIFKLILSFTLIHISTKRTNISFTDTVVGDERVKVGITLSTRWRGTIGLILFHNGQTNIITIIILIRICERRNYSTKGKVSLYGRCFVSRHSVRRKAHVPRTAATIVLAHDIGTNA